jgi:hypothetical protein
MTQLLEERQQVSDLRGSASLPRGNAMLEDPTGRRRRRLRAIGRLVAIALTVWLVALILGAIGLGPVSGIPFVSALRPGSPPPAVKRLPTPAPAKAADLKPALSASTARRAAALPSIRTAPALTRTPTTTRRTLASPRTHVVHTKTGSGQSSPTTTPVASAPTTVHTNNGQHAGTTNGQNTVSGNGHQTGTNNGNHYGTSTTTTTTTGTSTSPGNSGTAPGQSGTAPGQMRKSTTVPSG